MSESGKEFLKRFKIVFRIIFIVTIFSIIAMFIEPKKKTDVQKICYKGYYYLERGDKNVLLLDSKTDSPIKCEEVKEDDRVKM
jgi:hypothetical protein